MGKFEIFVTYQATQTKSNYGLSLEIALLEFIILRPSKGEMRNLLFSMGS